ncbi:MAG: hypothetical protein ACYCO4_07240 [Sulfobacillus sp.]
MLKIPPVASVESKGPLGVVQLPRLWSKVLLDAKGLLPDGYHPCGNGFDRVVLEGLGLDREAVVTFLTDHLPTYPQFETWVVSQVGPISDHTKATINDAILGFAPKPERRAEIIERLGLPADHPATTMVELNTLDDWAEFHHYLTEAES